MPQSQQFDSQFMPVIDAEALDAQRRSGADRRGDDRRRSTKGLFERRARRAGITDDRRQSDRRLHGWALVRHLLGLGGPAND